MIDPTDEPEVPRLHCRTVLRVQQESCQVVSGDELLRIRFATCFPGPRTERVSPGHLVAVAEAPGRAPAVVWRWYDAVVLGADDDLVRLWEPAHGEVLASRRPGSLSAPPGTRAYLSAGLPGADWWVEGPTVTSADDADVELDEVARLYTANGLWADVWS